MEDPLQGELVEDLFLDVGFFQERAVVKVLELPRRFGVGQFWGKGRNSFGQSSDEPSCVDFVSPSTYVENRQGILPLCFYSVVHPLPPGGGR